MSCYCGDCQKCGHKCGFCGANYDGYFPNDKPSCDCAEKYKAQKSKQKMNENLLDKIEVWSPILPWDTRTEQKEL